MTQISNYQDLVQKKIEDATPFIPKVVCTIITQYAAPSLEIEEMTYAGTSTQSTTLEKIKTLQSDLSTWTNHTFGNQLKKISIKFDSILSHVSAWHLHVVTARGGHHPSTLQGIMIYDSETPQRWEIEVVLSAPWNVSEDDVNVNRCRDVGQILMNYIKLKAPLINGVPAVQTPRFFSSDGPIPRL